MDRDVPLIYDRPGKGTTRFVHRVVRRTADVTILLMDPYEGPDLMHDGRLMLEHGAAGLWYVFPGAWYDIGRFHDRSGRFTGWYTNLCRPVEFGDDTWQMTDLFLDLWQPADGSGAVWLDVDEFAAAVDRGILDPSDHAGVRATRTAIDAALAEGCWPPAAAATTLEVDTARRLAAAP
jgi:predicted RNA-binding protein associated with RNAse of E/G family